MPNRRSRSLPYMRKFFVFILSLLLITTLICACENKNIPAVTSEDSSGASGLSQVNAGDSPESGNTSPSYSFEGTVFCYDGTDYDIAGRKDEVNVIMSCAESGDYIIVEGHISPKSSYYGLFNTKTREFEKEYIGVNLIMHEGDVDTLVYSSGADVLDYYGNIVANCTVGSGEYISNIVYTGKGYKSISVEISGINGEPRYETCEIR